MADTVTQITGERVSRGFFAALLEANKANCSCNACKILRSIADEMTKEFR